MPYNLKTLIHNLLITYSIFKIFINNYPIGEISNLRSLKMK